MATDDLPPSQQPGANLLPVNREFRVHFEPLSLAPFAYNSRMICCPICEKQFDAAASDAMPFCSRRCQQIDLGRWLREVYSVPIERDPDNEDDQSPGASPRLTIDESPD